MDQYELIRIAHRVYGKSIRTIAREYGHSRKTVRKALTGKIPKYRREQSIKAPMMDLYIPQIDKWLEQDQMRPKKQRHTSKRIYERLVEEYGFEGASSTVRRRETLRKIALGILRKETMIPRCPEIGVEAEVDWGEALVILGGEEQKVHLFCMRSRYSGEPFVRAYPCEKQEMFFEGHLHEFAYYGGVYRVLVYDNLKTAVKRVLKGKDRIEQDSFIAFRSYYTFEARFCNPGKGHEKGGGGARLGRD